MKDSFPFFFWLVIFVGLFRLFPLDDTPWWPKLLWEVLAGISLLFCCIIFACIMLVNVLRFDELIVEDCWLETWFKGRFGDVDFYNPWNMLPLLYPCTISFWSFISCPIYFCWYIIWWLEYICWWCWFCWWTIAAWPGGLFWLWLTDVVWLWLNTVFLLRLTDVF